MTLSLLLFAACALLLGASYQHLSRKDQPPRLTVNEARDVPNVLRAAIGVGLRSLMVPAADPRQEQHRRVARAAALGVTASAIAFLAQAIAGNRTFYGDPWLYIPAVVLGYWLTVIVESAARGFNVWSWIAVFGAIMSAGILAVLLAGYVP